MTNKQYINASSTAAAEVEPARDRQVGYELEFGGLTVGETADSIVDMFGGRVTERDASCLDVEGTKHGTFHVERDSKPLQKIEQQVASLQSSGNSEAEQLFSDLAQVASDLTMPIARKFVPVEIIAPPVPIRATGELDDLCVTLAKKGAQGTFDELQYAFGLHINPDAPALDAASILAVMQAYSVLYEWLLQAHSIDPVRRFSPFIAPYSDRYVEKITAEHYQPSLDRLVADYHTFNPTRNRGLDMLPLFAHLDEDLVRHLYGEGEKINPRPTYHYRLPNASVSDKDWSIKGEWEIWRTVETVADDPNLLGQMISLWRRERPRLIRNLPRGPKPEDIEKILESNYV